MAKILNRFSSVTLFEDKSRADLSGANLSGAYLSRANLCGADLSGANLVRAYLSGAYLTGANLSGAKLSGANLSGANLIVGGQRVDGYVFMLFNDGGFKVRAGCRYFTYEQAKEHWNENHVHGRASMILVDALFDMARCFGWKE